jgi:hypothetical protein
VHLFEELGEVLQAASAINQYRLHRGYHYPRSPQTATSAIRAEESFRREYADAVIAEGAHLYAIAKEKSLVSGRQFLAFCDAQGLEYEEVTSPFLNPDMVDVVIRAKEARIDPGALRGLVKRKLSETGVIVHLNIRATKELLDGYDRIIGAAYAGSSSLAESLSGVRMEHQYEVCEKPVVKLPPSFGQTDLVIMDGPFMCVDPIGKTGLYAMGNVVHAIHATNVGTAPKIPDELRPILNRGIIEHPPASKFNLFLESGSTYIPILNEAQYAGSLFTVRTVLPGLDATDARPTMVSALDDRFINIFSGKIGNCVVAAEEAVALISPAESQIA